MESNTLSSFIQFLDAEKFMPHGQCLLWKPDLLGLHVVSDLSIVLAYYSIPLALVYLVRKREDLNFGWIFMLFGLFIFLCGTTHLISIITVWQPLYWIEGWLKLITGIISVLTAFLLWPLIPKALALPSAKQLKSVNEELRKEIQERKQAEEALKEARESLEKEVEQRTSELLKTNQTLRDEIMVRESVEGQVSESQKRFETIFESALDAILVTNQDGNVLKWNKQAENIFGWSQEEILGKNIADTLIPSQYREAHLNGIQRYLSTGNSKILNSRIEIEAVNRDKQEMAVELSITYSGPQEKTFVAFLRDITDRRTAQKELIRAKEEAEYSNQAKSEFLARMSHELRTPMNAILGFGQLLQMDMDNPLPENQEDSVNRILKAGKHLLNLINEVLDLARVESGKMELSLENINVKTLVDEVYSLVVHLAEEIRVGIDINLKEELYLYADYIRSKQVLLNLVSNAVKYNRIGGTVTIDCKQNEESGRIQIRVADTGKGIPMDKQKNIFEPFTRVDVEVDQIEGTGIGLTIAKSLIESMNGTITFSSVFGQGSEFIVELPKGDQTTVKKQSERLKSKNILPLSENKKFKILYVEDNPENLDLVEQIMSKRPDIDLLPASSAEKGIEIAREEQPGLIIMDIHLPGMDGLTAFQRLKNYEETASIPVIALSADAMQTDKNRALAIGFTCYLTKPIDIPEFMETIDRFIK